jgi:SAM-dependent methyltransferase
MLLAAALQVACRRPNSDMADPLTQVMKDTAAGGSVLDVGCLGWRQHALAERIGRLDLRHYGVDLGETSAPNGCTFRSADLNAGPMPFDDDTFDLVVASHVLEHLHRPVEAFGEFVRVCRPGGTIYVEAPSERALWLPGMPFEHEKFYSSSFFDDPTHVSRPWTPQALHRLARYFGSVPERVGYRTSRRARLLFPWYLARALVTRNGELLEWCLWNAVGWAAYAVVRKPTSAAGKLKFEYFIPADR